MPKGIYNRTEWHKKICRQNAKIGSRITKFNLPSDTSGHLNGRWNGGKSSGFIQSECKKLRNLDKCDICGNIGNLYHHKDGNRQNNVLKNIMVLCFSCHAKIHERGRNLNKR
jgi:hypothetical protein